MKSIILSGGSGTRLWPLSRTYYPKQYVRFTPDAPSLFQQTFERSRLLAEGNVSDIYIVSNESQKFLIKGQIEDLGHDFPDDHILIEPSPKNTFPAIAYGIREILRSADGAKSDDIAVAVFPSDHVIRNEDAFLKTIRDALPASKDRLVTFGVLPDRPHTGYGYISPGAAHPACPSASVVSAFHEKPSPEKAREYLAAGYLWNAGIFLFNAGMFVREAEICAPDIFNAFFAGSLSIGAAYDTVPDVSIDYGMMEISKNVAVAGLDVGWNDMGSFDSFYGEYADRTDDAGNVIVGGDVLPVNSSGNLICAGDRKLVSLIGVEDMIVVDTDDSLLITKRDNAQHVRDIVRKLRDSGDPRADYHTLVYRPWGSYRILNEADGYKIKELLVLPGKKLSSQLHHHRSEHWSVVIGEAKVTLNGNVSVVKRGESTFIPEGSVHRLENAGSGILKVIESQIGDYCGEDDIVRFDDDFGRA